MSFSILSAIELQLIDWSILIGFLLFALGIGIAVSKTSGKDSGEFFLSGRNMPWWLLGFSMVATSFSTDTPNLVTDFVRDKGVSGNWAWWAFLVTGIVTVFFYARLWRRSEVLTDLELYRIRYSGPSARFLRGFRSLYLGVFINVLIMASVSVAAIKIGETMLGWNRYQSVITAMVVTTVFSTLGGFKGVVLTDFVLFLMAMIGSVAAAYFALSHESVGGLKNLLQHENVVKKLAIFPEFDISTSDGWATLFGVLLIPLFVQWWSTWYPGSEPGGGGYIAQRMLAAKNEKHAVGAVFFYQVAYYAIRPWPWIIVALCSLVVYPTLDDLKLAFPNAENVANDSGYSAMLVFLPAGWVGLVLTSLVAAYMSTISTHLNWGASYVVNDFWKQHVQPNASERQLIWVARVSTVVMMVLAALVAFQIESAVSAFNLLVSLGAGTGGVLLARWFWWRVNAASEIVAIVSAAIVSLGFQLTWDWAGGASETQSFGASLGVWSIPVQVALVTSAWLLTVVLTKPTDFEVLRSFVESTNPGGPGWRYVIKEAERRGKPIQYKASGLHFPTAILATITGCFFVYGLLFSSGYFLYGNTVHGWAWLIFSIVSGFVMQQTWAKMSKDD